MNTLNAKKVPSIKLNRDLYTYLGKLAKKEHRSINNFIETVLSRATHFDTPNKETIAAMNESETKKASLKHYRDAKSLFEDLEK